MIKISSIAIKLHAFDSSFFSFFRSIQHWQLRKQERIGIIENYQLHKVVCRLPWNLHFHSSIAIGSYFRIYDTSQFEELSPILLLLVISSISCFNLHVSQNSLLSSCRSMRAEMQQFRIRNCPYHNKNNPPSSLNKTYY